MKKIFALLLAAVMCFSLAACGENKEASNDNEPQTNENGSQQNPSGSQSDAPIETPDELKEVELTLDNWSEYFEIIAKEEIDSSADGKETIDLAQYFAIKSEDTLVGDFGVTVRIDCKMEQKYYTIDENGKVVCGDTVKTSDFRITADSSRYDTPFDASSPLKLVCSADAYANEVEATDKPSAIVPTSVEVFEIYGSVLVK